MKYGIYDPEKDQTLKSALDGVLVSQHDFLIQPLEYRPLMSKILIKDQHRPDPNGKLEEVEEPLIAALVKSIPPNIEEVSTIKVGSLVFYQKSHNLDRLVIEGENYHLLQFHQIEAYVPDPEDVPGIILMIQDSEHARNNI